MDIMLELRLIALSGFMGLYGLTFGMSIVVSKLMQRRERRQMTLLAAVVQQIPLEMQDRIATQVHCAYFGHKSLVNIILDSCSVGEVWRTITRLSEGLSPKVRVLGIQYGRAALPCRADHQAECTTWQPVHIAGTSAYVPVNCMRLAEYDR